MRYTLSFIGIALAAVAVGAKKGTVNAVTPEQAVGDTATIYLPGVVSDANEQWRISFTPDGRMAFFAESPGFFPMTRKATIYLSRLRNGQWSEPAVAPFSGTYSDIDPFVTADGTRIYFSSIRPVNGVVRGDVDLWYVETDGINWKEAVRLGDEVNSPNDELYPSLSSDGTLYFASGPMAPAAGQHFDIYSARPLGNGFAPREALPRAINNAPAPSDPHVQSSWEFNPEISPDGRMLVFTSLRPGFGLGDLYVSHFMNGVWTPAQNLGPKVNTAADEYHPTLSRDGSQLFYVRRGRNPGDFHVIASRALTALGQPPASLQSMHWLQGCWEMKRGAATTVERWQTASTGEMTGESRTVVNGQERESEGLRLFSRGDTLVYESTPSRQQKTEFRAISWSGNEIVFANPAHDFPQRIVYRRVGADSVVARIEGDRDNRRNPVSFPYARISCP
jgi:Tol biopolymer transport system component